MSSNHMCTSTNYQDIADFQLYLHLTDNQERDFQTNFLWDTLQNYKEKGIPINKIEEDLKSFPPLKRDVVTVLDVIKNDKRCTRFYDLVKVSQTENILDNTIGSFGINRDKITIFVPTNDYFNLITQALNIFRPYLTPKDIVKNHMVGIPLYWEEIKDRKLRIYSEYKQEKDNSLSYLLDGKNQIIVNQRTMDISIEPIINTCRILNYIETNNGNVFIIDKPIVPYQT